jgi:hypothetical protein
MCKIAACLLDNIAIHIYFTFENKSVEINPVLFNRDITTPLWTGGGAINLMYSALNFRIVYVIVRDHVTVTWPDVSVIYTAVRWVIFAGMQVIG